MAQAMVNFRMDAELKKTMEATCKEMGLTLTSAFTMFAAKVARERRIPFDVTLDTANEKDLVPACGLLADYANPALMAQEEGAFERAVVEHYKQTEGSGAAIEKPAAMRYA